MLKIYKFIYYGQKFRSEKMPKDQTIKVFKEVI
jgi:hypothetical protein